MCNNVLSPKSRVCKVCVFVCLFVCVCVRASACARGVLFEATLKKCILTYAPLNTNGSKNVSKIRTVMTCGGTRYHGCRMAFTIHNPTDLICVGLDNYN